MGGNGSYSKAYRGVPDAKRTHIDTNMRIGGHKVLLQKKDVRQSHNILNSHSADAIYVISKVNKKGVIQVHSIDIFQSHEISIEINLKFDSKGDLLPITPILRTGRIHIAGISVSMGNIEELVTTRRMCLIFRLNTVH